MTAPVARRGSRILSSVGILNPTCPPPKISGRSNPNVLSFPIKLLMPSMKKLIKFSTPSHRGFITSSLKKSLMDFSFGETVVLHHSWILLHPFCSPFTIASIHVWNVPLVAPTEIPAPNKPAPASTIIIFPVEMPNTMRPIPSSSSAEVTQPATFARPSAVTQSLRFPSAADTIVPSEIIAAPASIINMFPIAAPIAIRPMPTSNREAPIHC